MLCYGKRESELQFKTEVPPPFLHYSFSHLGAFRFLLLRVFVIMIMLFLLRVPLGSLCLHNKVSALLGIMILFKNECVAVRICLKLVRYKYI